MPNAETLVALSDFIEVHGPLAVALFVMCAEAWVIKRLIANNVKASADLAAAAAVASRALDNATSLTATQNTVMQQQSAVMAEMLANTKSALHRQDEMRADLKDVSKAVTDLRIQWGG